MWSRNILLCRGVEMLKLNTVVVEWQQSEHFFFVKVLMVFAIKSVQIVNIWYCFDVSLLYDSLI